MSASALLSILTGGALNGASGAAVSGTRREAASLNASETDAAGFADFSHLMDAETTATDVETDTVATPDVIASPLVPQAPAALVQGLPLTIAQATSTVGTVEVEVFAASDTGAAQAPDEAQASLRPAPQSELEQPATEEEPAGDITTDAVAVPVSAQFQTTAQAPAPTAPTATGSGTATSKVAELAAALLARSAPDETQDAPLAESETVQKSAEAQEAAQMLARQTASAQTTPASTLQAASRALQAQAAPLKVAPRTSGEASESLAAAEAEAGAIKASAETASTDAPKPATPDSRIAATAAIDAPAQSLTNDTAPQDTDTQAVESATSHPSEARHADTSRLSRATVETTAQIAASILRKLEGRTTRFDMVLTPEDLGSVEVSMEIDAEGRMTARMAFDNPAAATELRARAEELRRQLAEAGFYLSEKSLEFTDRESNPRGGFQQFLSDERSNRRAFAGANRLAAEADAPVPPVWTSITLSPSGVDMKV